LTETAQRWENGEELPFFFSRPDVSFLGYDVEAWPTAESAEVQDGWQARLV
jgi:hypothetical protein